MKFIESKQNAVLKHIRALSKKKNRDESGEYLIEGVRAVDDMLTTGVIKTIFMEEERIPIREYASIISRAKEAKILLYIVKEGLLDTVGTTATSQGILAIARKKTHLYSEFKGPIPSSFYLLLDTVQDPGNVGTIIRTAVAAGCSGIFMASGTVDLYNEKTVRSTMSAIGKIPIYAGLGEEDTLHLLSRPEFSVYALTMENAVSYDTVEYISPTLLIVGNEGNGISPALLELCKHRISIPMYGDIESLNVAIATALAMYKVAEKRSF